MFPSVHSSRTRLRLRTSAALTALICIGAALLAPAPASAVGTAPELTVVSSGLVTPPGTTAVSPGITRAPNGDLIVVYNDAGDGLPGAKIWWTRSSNDGATWSTPSIFKSPVMTNGSMNASLGITTLSNGTILVPFSEGRIFTSYTDRIGVAYVGKSTNSGATWTGLTTPITMPTPFYFVATYGRILELANGDLVMPIWGAKTAPTHPGGTIDPTAWEAGVLRSTDSGTTWGSYSRIGIDEVSPSNLISQYGVFPSNVTETSVIQLRDGSLLAVMRYDTTLGSTAGAYYQSRSVDNGVTWSEPVTGPVRGQGHAVIHAPCSAGLAAGQSKIMLAGQDLDATGGSSLTARISFDNGVTYANPTTFQRPAGYTVGGRDIYPDFVSLPGNKLFAVFMRLRSDGPPMIAYNVLQDASGTDCQTQYDTAQAAVSASPTVSLLRGDANQFAWPYARRGYRIASTSTLVSAVAAAAGPLMSCASPTGLQLSKNGVPLSPTSTVAAAGIVNGDVLTVTGPVSTDNVRVGFADVDSQPATGDIAQWDDTCASRFALDYRSRSLAVAVALSPGQQVTSLSIRDNDSATRLGASDYRIWRSADAKSWTEVSGWSYSSAVVGGRTVQTFAGLTITDPYVKVSQSQTGTTGYNVIINDSRADVTVTTTP